jgi:hypothetical protein
MSSQEEEEDDDDDEEEMTATPEEKERYASLSSHHGKGVSVETLRGALFPPEEKPFSVDRAGCVGDQFEVSMHVGARHGKQHRLGKQDDSTQAITAEGKEWQDIPRMEYKEIHWEAELLHLQSCGDIDGAIDLVRERCEVHGCTTSIRDSWLAFNHEFGEDMKRLLPGIPLLQDGTVNPWPAAGPEEVQIERWQAYHFKTSSGKGGHALPSLMYMRCSKSWLCQIFVKSCSGFVLARGKAYVKKACSRTMNNSLKRLLTR